ncbi:MAG: hypothetical protein QOF14_2517 [Hyphomicrobiales bacterium]|nr:hypothetical protein [Hyphomicrobiales bacterium]
MALFAGFSGAQCSKQERQGVRASRDRKSRQGYSGDLRGSGSGTGKTFRVGRAEIDDEADGRDRLERKAADSESANLDQTLQRGSRPYQHAAVRGLDMHAVVSDQPGKREGAGRACLD